MSNALAARISQLNSTQIHATAWILWQADRTPDRPSAFTERKTAGTGTFPTSSASWTLLASAGFGTQNVQQMHQNWPGHQELLTEVLKSNQIRRAQAQPAGLSPDQPLQLLVCPLAGEQRSAVLEFFFQSSAAVDQLIQTGALATCLSELTTVWKTLPPLASHAKAPQLAEQLQDILQEFPPAEVLTALLNTFCLRYKIDRVSHFQHDHSNNQRNTRETYSLLAISGHRNYETRAETIHLLTDFVREQAPEASQQSLRFSSPQLPGHTADGEGQFLFLSGHNSSAPPSDEPAAHFWLLEQFSHSIPAAVEQQIQQDWAIWQLAWQSSLAHVMLRASPRRRFGTRSWRMGIVLGLLLLLLIPIPLTISAPGQLWPVERRNVFAPENGIIAASDLHFPADLQLTQDQLLLTITNRELELRHTQLLGEYATVAEQIRGLRNTRSDRFQAGEGRPSAETDVSVKLAELTARLQGLAEERELLESRLASLQVKSPLKGAWLSWDSEHKLSGRPVTRGQLLLTIGNPQGAWEVLAEISDRDLGLFKQIYFPEQFSTPVESAGPVTIVSEAGTLQRWTGQVQQLAPVLTERSPGEYTATVRVALNKSETALLPGARVRLKAHCGYYPAGYVWFRSLIESARSFFTW